MIGALTRIFSKALERRNATRYRDLAVAIGELESELGALSDAELRGRTGLFRNQVSRGRDIDELLVPAFATVREAARRAIGQRPFDVQLVGGMALHHGRIAEIQTGEGKTLTATLPAYLNALAGQGVHVATINDYLTRRDAGWMGQVYDLLDVSVGVVTHAATDDSRRRAYACDITYGTAAEFGFDYLRDNMRYRREDLVQRGHYYAIVDEADSILIDDARTPLVISGGAESSGEFYQTIDGIVGRLATEHFEIDLKLRTANLSKSGIDEVERQLGLAGLMASASLFDLENIALLHRVTQALIAHTVFARDRDYIVLNGEVAIIDEISGRILHGRRHGDGLHQAIEAKERVDIRPESQTLASIAIQNYFRIYGKLSGMSGTASAAADEFAMAYELEVVSVPPHVASIRKDIGDEFHATEADKFCAVRATIEQCHARRQPVLVGTASVDKSERLAELMRESGWRQLDFDGFDTGARGVGSKIFALLNARNHDQEARIMAQAGVPGAVTIATTMAGRGVDIQLGGNADARIRDELPSLPEGDRDRRKAQILRETARLKQEAIAAGGLFVLGTERHESRRIDDQLRGRAGRQGDPGCSRFVLSLEDDLLRSSGSALLGRLLRHSQGKMRAGPGAVAKAIERAQTRVEARNFALRSTLLKYDDVLNDQRRVVFDQRRNLMGDEQISGIVADMRNGFVDDLAVQCIPRGAGRESWHWDLLDMEARGVLTLDLPVADWIGDKSITESHVIDCIRQLADRWMAGKIERWGEARVRLALRRIVMALLDDLWLRHVADMETLRRAAPLRAHGRRDPLVEFRIEGFEMFERMLQRLRRNVTAATMRMGFDEDVWAQPMESDEEHDVIVPAHLANVLH